MKVLVIGGGGREHALVWKLARDSRQPQLFCAPGNAGTAQCATNVALSAEDLDGLVGWAKRERPDLTVVGPEAPLCAGLVDRFNAEGLRIFGPSKAAAQIEGSKVFSKEIMLAAGVPTAQAQTFNEPRAAEAYVRKLGVPVVVKAEGLAAGKGVIICPTLAAAEQAIRECLVTRAFGAAGQRILVEEFLEGEEVSVLGLTDGVHTVLLASAQDHKRIFDNDQGPNTGGMGAYSPAPLLTAALQSRVQTEVFERTLAELRKRGIVYQGVLYAGLMIGSKGPKVLEFNCRFGDPETQAILPRMASDLIPAVEACIDGRLNPEMVKWKNEACVCVVVAAGGYPGAYEKGRPISGLERAAALADTLIFHAGTKAVDGQVVTSGGRVLGVTALGRDLKSAVARAYEAAGLIAFEGMQYRRDIAARALPPL
jgi:phosphoribosylamine--glycine ligase